jgi:acetylglutamate kinase
MRPIIVHGGGKAITAAMSEAGIEAHFVQGRRYTDERTLAIAEHVLVSQISADIVHTINRYGLRGMGLNSLGSCAVFAKQLYLQDPDDPKRNRIDIGLVGEVTEVNGSLIKALTEAGHIPVIAPITRDAAGGKLNVNADSVAGHVAAAVKALKLVLVSDTHGIRTDADDPDSLAQSLTRDRINGLIGSGVISSGMLPKVEAAMVALEGGVSKAHIIDGGIRHSLLLEVYTDTGIGTEIVL